MQDFNLGGSESRAGGGSSWQSSHGILTWDMRWEELFISDV